MFPIIGEVVIRTNGGKLTVNAPNDHMEHFGTLDFLQIEAIKTTASYIENGYTAQGQIKEGRVVNTKGTIEVNGKTKATGVVNLLIETNATGNGFGTVVVASKDSADLPTLDHGGVTMLYYKLQNDIELEEEFSYVEVECLIESKANQYLRRKFKKEHFEIGEKIHFQFAFYT